MRNENGVFMKGLWVFFVFLMIALFSISAIATEEPTGELNGDNLTLSYSNFSKGSTYKLDFPNSIPFNETCNVEGKLELNISDSRYPESLKNLTSREIFDVNVTNISDNLATKISVINKNPPIPTPTKESFLEKNGILLLIFGVFILALSALWFLLKLKPEENVEKRLPSPSLATSTNVLKVDLTADSGFVRVQDAKVKAVSKSGKPYPAYVGPDGVYTLELPKGTYRIEVDGGQNYEDVSEEISIPKDNRIGISLIKKQPVQIEVVDESGIPLRGVNARVMEPSQGIIVDIKGSPVETDFSGIAKFYVSKNKQYAVSAISLSGEFVNQENIPLSSSETTKKIQLFKKAGNIEITVSEQATGKPFAEIPVSLMKKGTSQTIDFVTDNNGRINQKLPIGEYIVRLKTSDLLLYNPVEKQANIIENRTSPVALDFRFSYQLKPEFKTSINKINEKLKTGYDEVSADDYDKCIPLFFKKVGEKPIELVKKIEVRPAEFLSAKKNPDEIINYILSTAEILADEISRIMREKSNVDFYFLTRNLPPVAELTVSDYSQEEFSKLVHETANYHKNHFRKVGNKLKEIDNELTQLSGTLTIQPVADLWRLAQKLQESNINEADAKKRGVMLFINDKLLDHVREMYAKEEVRARLAISMF